MSITTKRIEDLAIGAHVRYVLVELDESGHGLPPVETGGWSEATFQGRGANTALFTEGEEDEAFDWTADLTEFGWTMNDGFTTWRVEVW